MKSSDAFPSQYVSAPDLKGQRVPVVIERVAMVEMKEMDGSVIHKPAAKFQGTEKQMIINITNWNMIAELYGEDSDMWIGREIILYPARVPFGNKIVDAIRVDAPAGFTRPATPGDAFGGAPSVIAAPANPLAPAVVPSAMPPLNEPNRVEGELAAGDPRIDGDELPPF